MELQVRIGAVALALALLAACGGDDDDDGSNAAVSGDVPTGVEVIEIDGATHVDSDLDYPQSPPVGGDHNSAWQNCGAYREPVLDEHAVHSLEHGAVWIAYTPDLDDASVEALEAVADGQTHVLVTPYEGGLAEPISLQAWGRQLTLDAVDDEQIDAFVRAFQEGPQTPEPGAPCSGAIGTPR